MSGEIVRAVAIAEPPWPRATARRKAAGL
jgi:hypothetical protein